MSVCCVPWYPSFVCLAPSLHGTLVFRVLYQPQLEIEMIERLAALLCARAHFIFSIYLATYSSNSNSNSERFGIPTVIWHILYARTYGDQPIASTSS